MTNEQNPQDAAFTAHTPSSEPAGAEASSSAEAKAPEGTEVAELKQKLSDVTDRMYRIAADADNQRKRWDKERQDIRVYAIQEFARDLLPVIDAFDKAMSAVETLKPNTETDEGKQFAAVVEGIQIVSKVFYESIKKHGIERLPGKGEAFNPTFHSAVAMFPEPSVPHDTVWDEYTPGYKIGERVLRTAVVRVATPGSA